MADIEMDVTETYRNNGTRNYLVLTNQPSINNIVLKGNKTSAELGLAGAEELEAKVDREELAEVAFTGSFNDLTDKPEIPELPELATVATTGSFNDLTDKPNIPTVPELADVATTGDYNDLINIPQANGGGAIPAYIVGNTMLPGWLSLEENGTALEPVNYQEYIILSSGEWLRKHVMWDASKGVYRLTGKVEVSDELQREIIKETITKSQSIGGDSAPTTLEKSYSANNITLLDRGTVRFQFSYYLEKRCSIQVKYGNTILETITTTNNYVDGTYDKTFSVSTENRGLIPTITHKHPGVAEWENARVYGITVGYVYDDIFYDYETDDVLDITLEELEDIWASI